MAKPRAGENPDVEPDQSSGEPQGGESQQAAPSDRPTLDTYKTQGKTKVRVRRGHQVVPSDQSLPQFGAEGIDVTADQAKALVAEFPAWVYVDASDDDENKEG